MLLRKIKIRKNNNSIVFGTAGFTLLESLVAIAVLTVGVTASISAVVSSLSLAPKIENKLIAANLAQEGVEIVRNIRDTNWIGDSAFNAGLGDGWGCVQYDLDLLDSDCVSFGGSDVIKFNGSRYSHDVGVSTIFSRRITITNVSASEIKVESQVDCGDNCSITLEEHLFDWR